MRQQTFAVLGATGNIGRILVRRLREKGHRVRALGRDPGKLEALASLGADVIVLDRFDRADAMTKAFQGADAVFSFIPPALLAEDYGIFQDTVGTAIREAVQESGVRRVLNLSSIGAEISEGTGPIKGLHRHERRLNSLPGVRVLHLRPSYFMENLLLSIPLIKRLGVFGTPLRGDVPIAMVATADVGLEASELIERPDLEWPSIFELEGPRAWTMSEATRIMGGAIGKPELHYVQVPYATAQGGMLASGMKPRLVELVLEMNKAFNDGLVKPTQEITADHRGQTTLDQFAAVFAQAFNAEAGTAGAPKGSN